MRKIYSYECRRLLGNKIFWSLLAVLLWYAYQTLTGDVIRGVANTAPFSPWSFGYYLASLLPFLCLGELFFLTFFTSSQERQTAAVTRATPVDPERYALVRCGAVLTGTALMILCAAGLALWFYAHYFHWTDFGALLFPFLLVLLPPILFSLGAGWILGRIRPAFLYGTMAVFFLLPYLPVPMALDFMGTGFFQQYPSLLGAPDPPFFVPAAVLAGRAVPLSLGLLLTFSAICPTRRRSGK